MLLLPGPLPCLHPGVDTCTEGALQSLNQQEGLTFWPLHTVRGPVAQFMTPMWVACFSAEGGPTDTIPGEAIFAQLCHLRPKDWNPVGTSIPLGSHGISIFWFLAVIALA